MDFDACEITILGFLMKDDVNLAVALSCGINETYFLKHKDIWDKILDLDSKGQSFSFANLGFAMPDKMPILMDAMNASPGTMNFKYYLSELKHYRWCKSAAKDLMPLVHNLADYKTPEKKIRCVAEIEKIIATVKTVDEDSDSSWSLGMKAFDTLERRVIQCREKKTSGISTGMKRLDQSIQGFCDGRYYILAARTSIGKTTLAVNFANAAIDQGKNVLFFTVEMLNSEIYEKLFSLRSEVEGRRIYRGNLSEQQIDKLKSTIETLMRKNLSINHSFAGSIETLIGMVRRKKKENAVDLVIIDYAGLLKSSTKTDKKNYELGEISAQIKGMALALEIPVLLLCQLNRDAADAKPGLHHLRDSGSFEQDCDAALFLHAEKKAADNIQRWLIIGKNRWGTIGEFKIYDKLERNLFSDEPIM